MFRSYSIIRHPFDNNCQVVLGNIHIGEGAKIAACSVVVKAVPPGVTVAGCPATIVGQGKLQTSKSAGKTERRTNQEALMATLVPLCDNLVVSVSGRCLWISPC